MGQKSSFEHPGNSSYSTREQLSIGSIINDENTGMLHFLKQYSYTSQQSYHQAFLYYSCKLANKHQHILNLQKINTKVQNTFCSTFYKLLLVYQYIGDTLQDLINDKSKQSKHFDEKQVWSILCSCVLALAEMVRSDGKPIPALRTKDIRVTADGSVKILNYQMLGIDEQHDTISQLSASRVLVETILECTSLKPLDSQSYEALEGLIESLEYSNEFKSTLSLILSDKANFIEIEEHFFRLVQDDSDFSSLGNTPILKSGSKQLSGQRVQTHSISPYSHKHPLPLIPEVKESANQSVCFNDNQALNADPSFCFKMQPDQQDQLAQQYKIADSYERENPDENEDNQDILQKFTSRGQESLCNANQFCKNATSVDTIAQQIPHNYEESNSNALFTDPSLLSLIQSDLIKIKKRNGHHERQKDENLNVRSNVFGEATNTYKSRKQVSTNESDKYKVQKLMREEKVGPQLKEWKQMEARQKVEQEIRQKRRQKEIKGKIQTDMKERTDTELKRKKEIQMKEIQNKEIQRKEVQLRERKEAQIRQKRETEERNKREAQMREKIQIQIRQKEAQLKRETQERKQIQMRENKEAQLKQRMQIQKSRQTYKQKSMQDKRQKRSSRRGNQKIGNDKKQEDSSRVSANIMLDDTMGFKKDRSSNSNTNERSRKESNENYYRHTYIPDGSRAEQDSKNEHDSSIEQPNSRGSHKEQYRNKDKNVRNSAKDGSIRDSKATKDIRESREGKDRKNKEIRESIAIRDSRDIRQNRTNKELKDSTNTMGNREMRDSRGNREVRESIAYRDSRSEKDLRANRDLRRDSDDSWQNRRQRNGQNGHAQYLTTPEREEVYKKHSKQGGNQADKSSRNQTVQSQEVDKQEHQQQTVSFKKKQNYETVCENYARGRYQGTKLNGMRHGYGTFHYSEGGKYVGQWVQNKMSGKGTLYYPDGNIAYEGGWYNDQLTGYGVLYNQEVGQLKAPFDYRDWAQVDDYWEKYEGEFDRDNKEGKGKLYLVNGEVFEGHFKDDAVHGEGILHRRGGGILRGLWNRNELIRMF